MSGIDLYVSDSVQLVLRRALTGPSGPMCEIVRRQRIDGHTFDTSLAYVTDAEIVDALAILAGGART